MSRDIDTKSTDGQLTGLTEVSGQLIQRMHSVMVDNLYQMNTEYLTATDEANTVEATLNGRGWLAGLDIEHGLLRLGAETVSRRVNEALRNAQTAAALDIEARAERITAELEDATAKLEDAIGVKFADVARAIEQRLGSEPL